MTTKKELLKRIKSLEELLDVVYVKSDDKSDWEYHQKKDYGIFSDFRKLMKWYKKTNKVDED